MATRTAGALAAAAWALCGCNVLVGLDDVNIVQTGAGGGTGTAAPPGDGGTGGAGAGTGGMMAGTTGGGATGGSPAGTGGAGTPSGSGGSTGGGETSTSGTSGGETSTSGAGGGETSTSGAGGGSTSSTGTGGGTTSSSTGTGGGPPIGCGDGVIAGAEQCDDGNTAPGDGCSAACQVEAQYQCTVDGASTCFEQEVVCGDGLDNDGDFTVDFGDADCILPAYTPALPCSAVRIYRSVNVPVVIPDNGGGTAESLIFVPDDLSVTHTAVLLDISHGRTSDLEVKLLPPFGPPRDLTSDNGGNGANYNGTFFDSGCPQSVIVGSAPFKGCYKPESLLPANNQQAKGVWKLEVDDGNAGKTGTLAAWTLLLCAE